MAVRMISIWFFIGISLAVNGALILAAGIYQLIDPAGKSRRGLVSFTRQCMVGRDAVGDRYSLFPQVRASASILNAPPKP